MLNYTCMLTVLYQLFYLYYPPLKSMVLPEISELSNNQIILFL